MTNELYHYGILGMKWGVRRYQNKDGSLTPKGEKRHFNPNKTDDNKKKLEMKTASKNRRLLSDSDLKNRIERIRLEKQLKDLTADEITPGRKFVSDVMKQSGKKVASTVATGALLYAGKVALTRHFDAREAASYLTPKPKNK